MNLNFRSKKKLFKELNPKLVHHQELKKQNLIFGVVIFIIVAGLVSLTVFGVNFLIREINRSLKTEAQRVISGEATSFNLEKLEKIKEKLPELTPLVSPPSFSPELPISPLPSPTESVTSSPEAIFISPTPAF